MVRLLLVLLIASVAFIQPTTSIVKAQSSDRVELQLKLESLRAQLQAKEAVFLAPAPEDLAVYSEFLKQPNTGMARLMPREKYDKNLLIRGGGAYYSFTRRTNEYGYGSDIELEQGRLSVGFAGADFGFLTSLGNVPVEIVAPEDPAIRFLAQFNTPSLEPEAREQHRRSGTGFEVDGFTYRAFVPATTSTTYALRSINYDDSDVLVVFRVTRQDVDGSLILVWKMLSSFPAPRLTR